MEKELNDVKDMKNRFEAALELLGERSERVGELENDILDMKVETLCSSLCLLTP